MSRRSPRPSLLQKYIFPVAFSSSKISNCYGHLHFKSKCFSSLWLSVVAASLTRQLTKRIPARSKRYLPVNSVPLSSLTASCERKSFLSWRCGTTISAMDKKGEKRKKGKGVEELKEPNYNLHKTTKSLLNPEKLSDTTRCFLRDSLLGAAVGRESGMSW